MRGPLMLVSLHITHSSAGGMECLNDIIPGIEDAVGKALAESKDVEEDWASEARRYYIGIVGKFGIQVQNSLKKAATLDIQTICPLHGPVLTENLGHYIEKYDIW